MKKSETLEITTGQTVSVELVNEGEMVEYRSQRSKKIRTRVGQRFSVSLDGSVIGFVERRMQTRERKTPGRTYVNARWRSPGWVSYQHSNGGGRGLEGFSKVGCIERLVWDHMRS